MRSPSPGTQLTDEWEHHLGFMLSGRREKYKWCQKNNCIIILVKNDFVSLYSSMLEK